MTKPVKKRKRGKPLAPRKNEAKLVEQLANKVRRGELTLGEATQRLKTAPKQSKDDGRGLGVIQAKKGTRRVGDAQAVYRKRNSFKKKP